MELLSGKRRPQASVESGEPGARTWMRKNHNDLETLLFYREKNRESNRVWTIWPPLYGLIWAMLYGVIWGLIYK